MQIADRHATPPALPETLVVELTNHCNLHCPLCSTNLAMTRPRGFMSLDLFRQLTGELQAAGLRPELSFNMCGEPLLHPQAAEFVACAASGGFRTLICTNATPLTVELGEALIRAGLPAIRVCLDGATAASHELYRVGSSFDRVKRNIEALIETRARMGAPNPRITVQTLLTRASEGEIEQVLDWAWQAGADEVCFKPLSLGTRTTPEQKRFGRGILPASAQLRRAAPCGDEPCRYPFHHMLVYWNGDLGVCCIDFNNVAGLSSIREGGILARAASPEVVLARRLGCERRLPICKPCQAARSGFRGFGVPLAELRERGAGRPSWARELQQAGVDYAPR